MKTALIIIDVQNEYSKTGGLPVSNFKQLVADLNQLDKSVYDLIVSVKHQNPEGLFSHPWNTSYPEELKIDVDYQVVKQYADSFQDTNLQQVLNCNSITELHICGMMTQNCVTYTALTALNHDYQVSIIESLCGTVEHIVHQIAIKALSSKVTILK